MSTFERSAEHGSDPAETEGPVLGPGDKSVEEDLDIVFLTDGSGDSPSLENAFRVQGSKVSRVQDLRTFISLLRKTPMRIGVWCEKTQTARLRSGLVEIRACGVRCPLLVVLETLHAADRVELRRLGADDIVEAIRGHREIAVRAGGLATLVRRYRVRIYCAGSIRMDPDGRWVRCNDTGSRRSLHFAQQEFDFLMIHARHEGIPVPYRLADAAVFGRDMHANRAKRTNVKNKVVRKLSRISERKRIDNVRGVGYMLVDKR